MSGREYLEAIKEQLDLGRHQHRMGENILGAFGYVRRRAHRTCGDKRHPAGYRPSGRPTNQR